MNGLNVCWQNRKKILVALKGVAWGWLDVWQPLSEL